MSFFFFGNRRVKAESGAFVDNDETNSHFKIDTEASFRAVEKMTGKKPLTCLQEAVKLRGAPGYLTIQDYFLYRLFDDENLTFEDKKRFITYAQHWPLVMKCVKERWFGVTEDKWYSYRLLESMGLKTPETQAVIDTTARSFGAVPALQSVDALRGFLQSDAVFPLFCKPNEGIGSFGARRVTGLDGDQVLMDGADPMTIDAFFAEAAKSQPYLMQTALTNAEPLARFSPYVATVRLMNLVQGTNVSTPFTLIKIPSPTNIADNYWRQGNMLANIDPETGKLTRVIRGKGAEAELFDHHPELDLPMVGEVLPYWSEVMALSQETARFFAMQKFLSLDVALTPDGPVVVEVNTGASFDLPQLASGKGLLTDEVAEFFRSNGCKV